MLFLGKGNGKLAEETQKENYVALKIVFPRLLLQIVKGFDCLIKLILVLYLVFLQHRKKKRLTLWGKMLIKGRTLEKLLVELEGAVEGWAQHIKTYSCKGKLRQ